VESRGTWEGRSRTRERSDNCSAEPSAIVHGRRREGRTRRTRRVSLVSRRAAGRLFRPTRVLRPRRVSIRRRRVRVVPTGRPVSTVLQRRRTYCRRVEFAARRELTRPTRAPCPEDEALGGKEKEQARAFFAKRSRP